MAAPRLQLQMFGAAPDLIAADVSAGVWSDARGVVFHDGAAMRAPAAAPIHEGAAPAGPYLGVLSMMNAAGEPYWVVATAAALWACDASGWVEITPASGWGPTAASILTLHRFNGMAIVNDSVNGPFYWDGNPANDAQALPSWPSGWRCISMRSHAGFLFAIGRLDAGGTMRVNWSDAAEAGTLPGAWNPAADNLAGYVDLLPAASPCVDGVSLGNDFLVFKGESVHAFTYAGGNAVFAVRKRFNNIGLAGVGGFAHGPSERLLFAGSDGDIYVTDGMQLASVLEGRWQRTYYEQADPAQFREGVAGATLSRMGVSLIAFRGQGGDVLDRAMVYDWASGEVSVRTLPGVHCLAEGRNMNSSTDNSWDGDAGSWSADGSVWDFALTGSTGDDVVAGGDALYLISDGDAAGAFDVIEPVYLLKTAASLGNSDEAKLVRRVWPRIRGRSGESVSIRVGTSEEAEAPVRWGPAVAYEIGSGRPVDVLQRGRFVSLELMSVAGSDSGFSVGMVEIEAVGSGRW